MTAQYLRQSVKFLKDKFYIVPLLGACAFSGGIGLFTMGYTARNKTDVVFNRWAKALPEDRVDWTRPTQKLVMTNSEEYAGYKARPADEERLYQLIYASGEYRNRT